LIGTLPICKRAVKWAAAMSKRRSKAPKQAKEDKPRIARRLIDEALLMARLGLNEDWIEVWEDGDEERAESFAPSEIPAFIRTKIEREARGDSKMDTAYEREDIERTIKAKMDDVNFAIARLAKARCCKPVIYYCLNELSPESEIRRSRGELMMASKKLRSAGTSADDDSCEEQDIPPVMVRRELVSRDDVTKKVTKAAMKARKVIRLYQRELLLVADAVETIRANRIGPEATGRKTSEADGDTSADETEIMLPTGITTAPQDAVDALVLLTNSLSWVSALADAYAAPEQKKILKSKGLLFLTAYVELVIRECRPRERVRAQMRHYLTQLANAVVGTSEDQLSPSYLIDKLKKFKEDHPRLHDRLELNLDNLHQFHTHRYLRKGPFQLSHPQ
jgi:hypothetical protein